jgi:DNA-binding NarL/FixJ family response regulator
VTPERLTASEARVASLLAGGYSDGEIAAELAVRPHELERHREAAFRKLGVRSRTELALLLGGGAIAQREPARKGVQS